MAIELTRRPARAVAKPRVRDQGQISRWRRAIRWVFRIFARKEFHYPAEREEFRLELQRQVVRSDSFPMF